MSRYEVTEIGHLTKDGKVVTLREVCNELREFEYLAESVDALIDREFSPDDLSGPLNIIRRFLHNYKPKTESELLEERLKAADALLRSISGRYMDHTIQEAMDAYADSCEAHKAAKS